MLVIILTVAAAVYCIIGLSFAIKLWPVAMRDVMRQYPDMTDAQLKPLVFMNCMLFWPVILSDFRIERSDEEGIGLEFRVDEDDDERR